MSLSLPSESLDKLLEEAAALVHEVPALVHTWRFAVGAIYALGQYYQLAEAKPQTQCKESAYVPDTEVVITALRNGGDPPLDWLRGFWYYAAVMRADAVYERVFRALLGETSNRSRNGRKLYDGVRATFSQLLPELYRGSLFRLVRDEANSVKHYVGGPTPLLRERITLLRNALEHLFALLRDPHVRVALRNKYPGREPVSGPGIAMGQ